MEESGVTESESCETTTTLDPATGLIETTTTPVVDKKSDEEKQTSTGENGQVEATAETASEEAPTATDDKLDETDSSVNITLQIEDTNPNLAEAESSKDAEKVFVDEKMEYVEFIDEADVAEGQETLVVIPTDKAAKQVIVQTDEGEQTVMMQEVTDENGQIYLVPASEEMIILQEEETSSTSSTAKTNSVKKPREDVLPEPVIKAVPSHILGRRIDNPAVDPFRNGKVPPKPRLGVKIPYRNLTSQIVSKQDITNEIVNRGRQKFLNENKKTFAGLQAQLAKKMAPKEKISNNTELMAILTGEEEKTPPPGEMTREMEREIALKQLSELPDDPPEVKKKVKTKEDAEMEKQIAIKQLEEETKEAPKKRGRKPTILHSETEAIGSRFGNTPVKTYSRVKTYSTKEEDEDFILPTLTVETKAVKAQSSSKVNPTTASPATSGEGVYVTKSSRVIKRKVIWTPDDAAKKVKVDAPKNTPKKDTSGLTTSASGKKPETPRRTQPERKGKQEAEEVEEEEDSEEEPPVLEKQEVSSPKGGNTSTSASVSASASATTPKKQYRKRFKSEIDKLLGDEGAVNMLYSLNTPKESPEAKKKRSLKSKTTEVINELKDKGSVATPKSLRKKDNAEIAPPPVTPSGVSRQVSKDSRASSPPQSPESRIVRRHSSSSFESDGERKVEDGAADVQVKRMKMGTRKSAAATGNSTTTTASKAKNKFENFSSVKVVKEEKLVKVVMLADEEKKIYLDAFAMQELITVMREVENDDEVNAIALTGESGSFCHGIDYRTLVNSKENIRKNFAKKLATSIKDLLETMLNFTKEIIAVVEGCAVGLGVAILLLCDYVVAKESSTFSIPNNRYNCDPEGSTVLFTQLNKTLIGELIYHGETVDAQKAFENGLVNKKLSDEEFKKFNGGLKKFAKLPTQNLKVCQNRNRVPSVFDFVDGLNKDMEVLIVQWCDVQCQQLIEDHLVK